MARRKFHSVAPTFEFSMASLHHHYFITHPREEKDGNESGMETSSFFFPQE